MKELLRESCSVLVESLFGSDYVNDENLKETPERIYRMYNEMIFSKKKIIKQVNEIFAKTFPTKSKSIIVSPGIKAFSVCPHHLLPVEYNVIIGYQPLITKDSYGIIDDGKVIGASKLTRLARLVAKQAILQEDYLYQLSYLLNSHLKPAGTGIIVIGHHGCMRCRGIKSQGSFCNSELTGSFRDNEKIRSEFYSLIELSKG